MAERSSKVKKITNHLPYISSRKMEQRKRQLVVQTLPWKLSYGQHWLDVN